MEIVILDAHAVNPGDLSWAGLEALGNVRVYDRTPAALVIERARGARIVITNKTLLSAETIAQLHKLEYIGVLSTGCNVVDLAAAEARGIPVCNAPAYSTYSVAQAAISLILECACNTGLYAMAVKRGDWCESPDFCLMRVPVTELCGKTLGIIGYGAIGGVVAKTATALGMRVIADNPTPIRAGGTVVQVSLEELYAQSDVVSLHCPLCADNACMIDAEAISRMKDGVIIINTARGGLIDENAVVKGLESGKIGAFGADVLASEPPMWNNPLLKAPRCYIMPHVSWASKESRARLIGITVSNLAAFLATGKPVNNVWKKR